jgi:hypothetical protein
MNGQLRTFVYTEYPDGPYPFYGFELQNGKLDEKYQAIKDKIPPEMIGVAFAIGGGQHPRETCAIIFTGKEYSLHTEEQEDGFLTNDLFALDMVDEVMADTKDWNGVVYFVI